MPVNVAAAALMEWQTVSHFPVKVFGNGRCHGCNPKPDKIQTEQNEHSLYTNGLCASRENQ